MDRQMDEGTSGKHYVSSLAGWRHKNAKTMNDFYIRLAWLHHNVLIHK